MIPMADFPFNQPSPFDLSSHVSLEEGPVECPMPSSAAQPQGLFSPVAEVGDNSRTGGGGGGGGGDSNSNSNNTRSAGASDGGSGGGAFRVAFRTKSEVDIMDDGFQWRKYGKKSVKNSPNPRNYYRCSTDGCSVKKRVERDPEEPSYVITTYEGIHNHTSPDVVYYATQDSESGRFVVSGCRQIPRSP